MDYSKIEESFIETLKKSDLPTLAKDIGEVSFDTFIENGIIKNIPVLNSLHNIYKLSQSYRDYCFQKKILLFIFSLKDVPPVERKKFIDDMEKKTNYKQHVGGQLLMLLEKFDHMDKPEMMAKVIKAYIKGKINFIHLQRLYSAIDKLFYYDLPELRKYYSEKIEGIVNIEIDPVALQNLANCGLLKYNLGAGGGTVQNELGRLFFEIVQEDKISKK